MGYFVFESEEDAGKFIDKVSRQQYDDYSMNDIKKSFSGDYVVPLLETYTHSLQQLKSIARTCNLMDYTTQKIMMANSIIDSVMKEAMKGKEEGTREERMAFFQKVLGPAFKQISKDTLQYKKHGGYIDALKTKLNNTIRSLGFQQIDSNVAQSQFGVVGHGTSYKDDYDNVLTMDMTYGTTKSGNDYEITLKVGV